MSAASWPKKLKYLKKNKMPRHTASASPKKARRAQTACSLELPRATPAHQVTTVTLTSRATSRAFSGLYM